MSDYTLAELERRLNNVIRFGTIASVDLNAATCRVKLTDDHTTGDLLWQTRRAGNVRVWSAPTVGEQVMLLSPAGDLTQAIVLPSLYQNLFPAPSADPAENLVEYDDGAVISYNLTTHHLQAALPSGGTINIVADAGITIKGTVTVNGDVIADGISLKTHRHGGVVPGGSNTQGPN